MTAAPMPTRRLLAGTALAAVAAVALTACDFEAPDETSREKSPVQGVVFNVGSVEVRDAFLVTPPESSAGVQSATPTTYLVATIINQAGTADTLTGITATGGTVSPHDSSAAGAASGLTLPPGVLVSLGDPQLTTTSTTTLTYAATSGTAPVVGTSVPMTFSFGNAGSSASETVPVIDDDVTTGVSTPVPSGPVASPPSASP